MVLLEEMVWENSWLVGNYLGTEKFLKAFRKISVVKTFLFYQILQHMPMVWPKPLMRGKKKTKENIWNVCRLEKRKMFCSNLGQSTQASSCLIENGEGLFWQKYSWLVVRKNLNFSKTFFLVSSQSYPQEQCLLNLPNNLIARYFLSVLQILYLHL